MRKITLFLMLTAGLLVFCSVSQSYAQIGKRAKRAALRSKSRPLTNFTNRNRFPKSKRYLTVGGGLGAANYFGDLAPSTGRLSTDLKLTRTYFNGFVTKRYNPYLSLRASLAWTRLRGDDFSSDPEKGVESRSRYLRNLHFRNDLFEVNFSGTIDFLPTDQGFLRRNFLNPYVTFGVSVFTNNPKAKTVSGDWVALQPLRTEGQGIVEGAPKPYSTIQVGIPLGVGVRYRLKDKLDIGFEATYRLIFTDYLDDVATSFVKDGAVLPSDLSRAMSNRSAEPRAAAADEDRNLGKWVSDVGGSIITDPTTGRQIIKGYEQGSNPRGHKNNDYYIVTSIYVAYIIDVSRRAPKFR